MVEHIESLELELTCNSLCNRKVLEERGIGEVISGAAESIASDISDGAEGRANKWSRLRTIGGERSNRGEDTPAMRTWIESGSAMDE